MNAQTSYTGNTSISTGLWDSSRWSHNIDAPPYINGFIANNSVSFAAGDYTFTGARTSGTVDVGNITLESGATVTFTASNSFFGTGGQIRTLNIASGAVLNFGDQFISTNLGTGFIKVGDGVLAIRGASNNGGFTLDSGTVIARTVNAFGVGASNVLTLNGGTVASNGTNALNASRDFDASTFGGGIVVGGNVQFGELSSNVSLANSSANLSFASSVNLGDANRTLVLGNDGVQTFSGVISNTGSEGVTFGANAGAVGRFDITNASNTFSGAITITGGEVRFTSDGSMGNANNDIRIDGGRFATLNNGSLTLGAGRDVFIGDTAGTAISVTGGGTLTINTAISDISGKTGSWAKQGSGTLELGGASSYTGNTAINSGTLRLTTGNDRLPTGTVVSLGQAGSVNVATLDLNGQNQTIAGLNSVTGTNATTSNNIVTSSTAATLTLGGSGSYSYGDGTNANSGTITGAVSVVKSGSGTQVLGDTNSYSGTTTVNEGSLVINGAHTGGGTTTINGGSLVINGTHSGNGATTIDGGSLVINGTHSGSGATLVNGGTLVVNGSSGTGNVTVGASGTLAGTGTIGGNTTIAGSHNPGNSPGIQTFAGDLTYTDGAIFNWELIDNTTVNAANPNALFDSVVVSGNLDFGTLTNLNLIFNASGSAVDWTDGFWGESKIGTGGWLIFDVAGSTSNFDKFTLSTLDWADGNGVLFSSVLNGSSFSLFKDDGSSDVFLNYNFDVTAVPEPSSLVFAGIASGVAAIVRARRRRSAAAAVA